MSSVADVTGGASVLSPFSCTSPRRWFSCLTNKQGAYNVDLDDKAAPSALPVGWEKVEDPRHGTYYIDHVNKTTQFQRPVPDPGGAVRPFFTKEPGQLRGLRLTCRIVKSGSGFGFTIIGAPQSDQQFLQIKSIVANGPAHLDGTLRQGDVLVFINSVCVLGFTHQDVIRIFQFFQVGETISLEVCRGYDLPFDSNDPNTRILTTLAVTQPSNVPGFAHPLPSDSAASALPAHDNYVTPNVPNGALPAHSSSFNDVDYTNFHSNYTWTLRNPSSSALDPEREANGLIDCGDAQWNGGATPISAQRQDNDSSFRWNGVASTGQEYKFTEGLKTLEEAQKAASLNYSFHSATMPNRGTGPVNGSKGHGAQRVVPESMDTTKPQPLYQQRFPRLMHVLVSKGITGFGFTLADSPNGQVINSILDDDRCHDLRVGDRLMEINGFPVLDKSHASVIQILKDIPVGTDHVTTFLVQRLIPSRNPSLTLPQGGSLRYPHTQDSALSTDRQFSLPRGSGVERATRGLMQSASYHGPVAGSWSRSDKQQRDHNAGSRVLRSTSDRRPGDPPFQGYQPLALYPDNDNLPSSYPNFIGYPGRAHTPSDLNCSTSSNGTRTQTQLQYPQARRDPRPFLSRAISDGGYTGSLPRRAVTRTTGSGLSIHPTSSLQPERLPLAESDVNVSKPSLHQRSRTPGPEMFQTSSRPELPNRPKTPTAAHMRDMGQQQREDVWARHGATHELSSFSSYKESPNITEMTVFLQRQPSGFGFRVIGGLEEGSQVAIGQIVPRGAADLDGTLCIGDEILYVDGVNVQRASHQHVVQLLSDAAAAGVVSLTVRGLRQQRRSRTISAPPDTRYPTNGYQEPGPGDQARVARQHSLLASQQSDVRMAVQRPLRVTDPMSNHFPPSTLRNEARDHSTKEKPRNPLQQRLNLSSQHSTSASTPSKDEHAQLQNQQHSNSLLRQQSAQGSAHKPAVTRRSSLLQEHYPYTVTLSKHEQEGFGFVIVSSFSPSSSTEGEQTSTSLPCLGRINPGSPADACRRLRVGQRIMAVDDIPITNLHHEQIVSIIKSRGNCISLTVGAPPENESQEAATSQLDVMLPFPFTKASLSTAQLPRVSTESEGYTPSSQTSATPSFFKEAHLSKPDDYSDAQPLDLNITLVRGLDGFGFSIRGGLEFGGLPLYVLKVAEVGAAKEDGRLMAGDEILSINDISTKGMTHAQAVEFIQSGGHRVKLFIRKTGKPPPSIDSISANTESVPENNKDGWTHSTLAGTAKLTEETVISEHQSTETPSQAAVAQATQETEMYDNLLQSSKQHQLLNVSAPAVVDSQCTEEQDLNEESVATTSLAPNSYPDSNAQLSTPEVVQKISKCDEESSENIRLGHDTEQQVSEKDLTKKGEAIDIFDRQHEPNPSFEQKTVHDVQADIYL